MNTSISEYSSGCESGWTTYLDQDQDQHYSYSTDLYTNYYQRKGGDDDDDEDLSMVSDASSAPPHYQNNYYAYPPSSSLTYQDKTKTKTKSKSKTKTQKDFCLDDTASSSIFHFSQDNVPHSDDHNSAGHVYSGAAAHFENESRTKKKGLSFFKSSTKGKSSGGLLGRKRQ